MSSSMIWRARAARWHGTDHGPDRPPPRRRGPTPTASYVAEKEPDWVSPCWCCCKYCDPDWNLKRPNPYWAAATAEEMA